MNKIRTDRVIIAVVTMASIAYTVVSYVDHWEFWTAPLLLLGAVALWIMHITQRMEERYRQALYLLYGMVITFFHGVHESSFFDVPIVAVLMLVLFSLLNRIVMLDLILAEFFILMGIQIVLDYMGKSVKLETWSIPSLALHVVVVLLVFYFCRVMIKNRQEYEDLLAENTKEMDANANDMDDFLTNVSHELRTPVNVVNGMSSLVLKKHESEEVAAIRQAGIRLSYQIEDIQDYTEIQRDSVLLEEENYMCTSLINDVVAGFRNHEKRDELELVVDLDPKVPTLLFGDIKKLHKMFRHVLGNALKYTTDGGVYMRVFALPKEYGVNLCIEVRDTGIGMSRKDLSSLSQGMYQANKKRNRSTGGIGLGLPIVYGFVHKMGGFVKIESEKSVGTTVRIAIPQKVVDDMPCLRLGSSYSGDVIFHVNPEKYKVPEVRDFYRDMATNLASGLNCSLYSASSAAEVTRLIDKLNVKHIFMGEEEYEADPQYFEKLSEEGIVVTVSAHSGFEKPHGSRIMVMPKPLYGFPATKILNEGTSSADIEHDEREGKVDFSGLRTLIVDDEPMNLIVATGLFREYHMITETAQSGKEAIEKYRSRDYDVIFMDHMMPEMDGVETMKRIRSIGAETGKVPLIIALTANAVSGAREMFMREGFDAFIAKPIDTGDFERTLKTALTRSGGTRSGADSVSEGGELS